VNLTFGTGLGTDIETGLACGGAVWIIACIEGPAVIERILSHGADRPGCRHALKTERDSAGSRDLCLGRGSVGRL
jgi:hypothetical protein